MFTRTRANRHAPSTLPATCALVLYAAAGLALPTAALARQIAIPERRDANAIPAPAAERSLPITRITLLRSGVGSFERRGSVTGDALISLQFDADQINDILKSMVVLDLSGGVIRGVGYASKDPLNRRLSSFGIDIADSPSLGQLLDRLRGVRVALSTPDGEVTGTVLSVEKRPEAAGSDGAVIEAEHVNIVAAGLRSVRLSDLRGMKILDESLAADLDKALAAFAEQRAERVKTVRIDTAGTGERTIAVAYVHETPVWKTSYRLVLPESDSNATLQGWAIVENPTDEDWTDVRLSLAAGQPVSFRMDLYEPLYAFRPLVPVPMAAGIAPRVYDMGTGLADGPESLNKQFARPSARGRADSIAEAAGAPGAAPAAVTSAPMLAREIFEASVPAAAQAAGDGAVFRYELREPVTIERRQSAMLPILSANIPARRVSIYTAEVGGSSPMRGVEITNASDLQLIPGPIAVFDEGTYAGDAQIGHVPAGDKRLLAYAADLDVLVTRAEQTDSQVVRVRIVRGLLEQFTKIVRTANYEFTNKDAKNARSLIVEEFRHRGHELVGMKPSDTTPNAYRFEVTLAPGKAGTLSIPQEITTSSGFALVDADVNEILRFLQHGKASPAVRAAIQKIADRRAEIARASDALRADEQRWGDLERDQTRLRENLRAVDRTSELYAEYMRKLTEQEALFTTLGPKIESSRAEIARLREALANDLAEMSIE